MIKTIKEDVCEYVSIAMDNEELSDEMLDKILADEGACQKWYEYHLISDCLKQQPVGRDADFMQSSMFTAALAEISQEHQARHAAQSVPRKAKSASAANHVFKGFAVAASLAAVAVSVWQFWPQAQSDDTAPVAVEKTQQENKDIVSVRAEADNKNASEPVLPNAAKQLPNQQTTVRVESKAAQTQKDVVQ